MKNFKKFIAVALAVFVSVFMLAVSAFASDTDSLVRMDDGTWNYMENGEHNTDYTGLVKYYDTYYYVENGVLDWSYTGPTEYNGTTYFVTNSTLDENYSSLVLVDGVWHYVENGVYSNDYSGLTLYYGTWYYVEDGVLNWDYTGLTLYYGTWYYLEEGFLNWNYYGLTNYYGTYYGVEGGILDWNFSGALRYGTSLYYVRNGVFDSSFNGEAEYCTGKIYNFKDGVSVDYDGYVADAAQLLALIEHVEDKKGNTVTLASAQGIPDMGSYGGVVVTVNVKYKDGTEEKFSVAAAKSYFETSELPGVREDIGDGSLFVTGQISGDYETDNSVKLSNDAVSDYFDGIESFWVLNISE